MSRLGIKRPRSLISFCEKPRLGIIHEARLDISRMKKGLSDLENKIGVPSLTLHEKEKLEQEIKELSNKINWHDFILKVYLADIKAVNISNGGRYTGVM